jgi:trans-aconitate 2-methyltransferase
MTAQNWNASDYANQSQAQFKWATEMISTMTISQEDSILDIGCGDGKITALLAKMCLRGHVVGIDVSQDMIEMAKFKYNLKEYANLSFQHLLAQQLLFKEEFDIVFSNSTMHWIVDHIPVLKGIYSALKPNGRVYLKFGGLGT